MQIENYYYIIMNYIYKSYNYWRKMELPQVKTFSNSVLLFEKSHISITSKEKFETNRNSLK